MATYTAGLTDTILAARVPENERWVLQQIHAMILTGDNQVLDLVLRYQDAFSGALAVNLDLLVLSSGTTLITWPDIAGRQTVDRWCDRTGILLEPGTGLFVSTDGTGVAAGTIGFDFLTRRTLLHHARPPYSS